MQPAPSDFPPSDAVAAGASACLHAPATPLDLEAPGLAPRVLGRMFDASPVGVAFLSPPGRFVKVNPALCALLGRTEDELLATEARALTFPDDQAVTEQLRQETLEGARSGYRLQSRFLGREGNLIWTQVSVELVRDEAGVPLVFVAQVQEVGSRWEAERLRALTLEVLDILNRVDAPERAAADVLQVIHREVGVQCAAIRLASGGDFPYAAHIGFPEDFIRAENSVLATSPQGAPLLDEAGCPRLECTCGLVLEGRAAAGAGFLHHCGGSLWMDEVPPCEHLGSGHDPRLNPRNTCLRRGFRTLALIPIRSGDNIVGLLQLDDPRPHQLSVDTVAFLEGLCGSIGLALARKKAEAALRESEEKFAQVFRNAPMLMTLSDAETGRFLDVNDSFVRISGFTREEALGRTSLEIGWIAPATRALLLERMRTDGIVTSLQMATRSKDGRSLTCLYSGIQVSVGGRPCIISTVQDLSRLVEAQKTQRRLEAQLHQSQKMESLGCLAGGVAHDLNNVLGAILSLSTATRSRLSPPDPTAAALDTITKACLRGRDVVRSLLLFAQRELEEERPVDLNATLRELVQLLAHTTLQRVTLEVSLAEPAPLLLGDESSLSHAVMNLCLNAVDAMPSGGTLRLCTRWSDEGGIELSVRDEGIGMSPEILEKATEPFFTTKPTGAGTGLGLAMVYGTMKSHDGELILRSQPAQGTEAIMAFPAARLLDTSPPPVFTAAPLDEEGRKLRVLVVDDDDLIREAVVPMVEVPGHEGIGAAGGAEAVRLLAEGLQVDLVILDMNMPGVGGAETLPLILRERPDQAIVIASGYEDAKVRTLKSLYPQVECMSKPFTLDELRRVVAGLQPRRRPPAPSPSAGADGSPAKRCTPR